MAKLSGLKPQEQELAEQIAGGSLRKDRDAAVLGVGFVLARRKDPTLGLVAYQEQHDAEAVRAEVEWGRAPRKTSASS